jgi:hypothetical protein
MQYLSLILSVVSIVISCVTFAGTIYYQYYRADLGLITFPFLVDSANLHLTDLEMDFAFSNPGNRTVLIEDINLIMLVGTLSSRPRCTDANVLIQYRNQSLNPTPMPPGAGGLIAASSFQVGKDAPRTHAFAIGSGNTETVAAKFDISPTLWENSTTVVASCPVFRYADPFGKVWESICEGWRMSAIMMKGALTPRLIEPPHGSFALLPLEKSRDCATIAE